MPFFKHLSDPDVLLEAIQWTGDNFDEIQEFAGCVLSMTVQRQKLFLDTAEGPYVLIGDWVVRRTASRPTGRSTSRVVNGEIQALYTRIDDPVPRPWPAKGYVCETCAGKEFEEKEESKRIGSITAGEFADFFGCDARDVLDAWDMLKAAAGHKKEKKMAQEKIIALLEEAVALLKIMAERGEPKLKNPTKCRPVELEDGGEGWQCCCCKDGNSVLDNECVCGHVRCTPAPEAVTTRGAGTSEPIDG